MSSAPTGWQTPKTDWAAKKIPNKDDFNRMEGNINAIEAGNRTIDPTQVPAGNSGTLRQFLDWITNRFKAITGKANWYDAPDTTLAAAKGHMDATNVHSATSEATASRIMMRDANGRAKVAAPSAADDIARKDTVDAHAGITASPHGATSTNTANRIVTRDANGNFSAGTITANLNGNADSVDNIHFRVNNGTFEYNDGTGWKPVGGPMSSIMDRVESTSTTYETILDLTGAGFLEGFVFAVASSNVGEIRITVDGTSYEDSSGSGSENNIVLGQRLGTNGFPFARFREADTGPVRVAFKQSLKIEIRSVNADSSVWCSYVVSKF